jgi:hypothetical protein
MLEVLGFKVSGVPPKVDQPSCWSEKFTRLRRATSLIEKETSLEPKKVYKLQYKRF